MIGPALTAARKKAGPGRCFSCRRRVASGATCSRTACRRSYSRLWARDNRASSTIRKVVRRTPSPFRRNKRIDALSCGHGVEVRRTAPKAKRRHCRVCAARPRA